MLTFKNVYSEVDNKYIYPFLYDVLKEREDYQSISHKSMPSYEDHVMFIKSKPYVEWYIIEIKLKRAPVPIGAMYITRNREIGISILKKYRRKGHAKNALSMLLDAYGSPLYANINPLNKASIALFSGLGFKHIQNTYKLR